MNIIFFGSSQYSTIVEKALNKQFGLSLVVTIPDRVIGRKKILTPSPVKTFASKNTIPLITTDTLNEEIIHEITKTKPDFLIVDDYRLILPDTILQLPKHAALNVHHSLLPKYRGPSPAPSAILSGETQTGVSIIKMGSIVDAGDILAQKTYEMKPDETTDSLLTRLNTLGAEIIIQVIKDYEHYYQNRQSQNEQHATYTKHMKKTDGCIDIQNPPDPKQLDRMIRAYYPWPTVWTQIQLKTRELRIKLLPSSHPEPSGRNILIQPEGKKPMNMKDFLNGYPEAKKYFEKIFSKSNL